MTADGLPFIHPCGTGAACVVCGMQDDLNATLVLCETADCPKFSSCHVECMALDIRPPVAQEPAGAEQHDGEAEQEGVGVTATMVPGSLRNSGSNTHGGARGGAAPMTHPEATADVARREDDRAKIKAPNAPGAKLGPFGRPRSLAWRPGDPKRTWDLHDFSWYCSHCQHARSEKVEGSAAMSLIGNTDLADVTAFEGTKDTAPASGGLPVVKPELTHTSRRLLKQYFELCASPDAAQLSLLAAMTERSPADTQAWFHERALQRQREERQKQQCARFAHSPYLFRPCSGAHSTESHCSRVHAHAS